MNKNEKLAKRLVEKLTACGLTVCTAESCTGGLIAKLITDVPGSSAVFAGGCVSYTEAVKHRVLGVSQEVLDTETAVSEACAKEMAQKARELFGTDIAVSATGYAGPGGGTERDPVGTVYIGAATKDTVLCRRISAPKSFTRAQVRELAACAALYLALGE